MANLRNIFEELSKQNQEIYSLVGEVTAIDTDAMSCDVQPLNGSAEIFGVRMSADPVHSGLHLIPIVGSRSIVTFLSKDVAFLSLVSDLDYYLVDIDDVSFRLDKDGTIIQVSTSEHSVTSDEVRMKAGAVVKVAAGGVLVANGAESLRAILDDLITQISLLTVGTPAGPSTVPVNAAAFTLIKTRLATLLTN